jgi:hypothetical protein
MTTANGLAQAQPLTVGTYAVDLPCPRCGSLEAVLVRLTAVVTEDTDTDTATIKLRARSRAAEHLCGSSRLLDAAGQLTIGVAGDEADEADR